MQAFTPSGATVNIDVAAASARVALGNVGGPTQVRVMNNGTATVWVKFGDGTVTATLAAGMPVGPGVTEVVTIAGETNVAAIAAGATGKIYFTPGAGI